MAAPQKARAIGGFNLTAQRMGFLQPLLVGDHGDNQTYIQRLDGLTRVAGFDIVAWPERDTVSFQESLIATVNGESLWSFLFPDELPLILPWEQFRQALGKRIDANAFANHPLLEFDVVQTLNLDEKKDATFKRAFDAYAQAGPDIAERWRDRAILEPELRDALSSTGKFGTKEKLRAYLVNGVAKIELSPFDDSIAQLVESACRGITARYGAIFPKLHGVEASTISLREPAQIRESRSITVVLVGKLRSGNTAAARDYVRELDVINGDHLPGHLRRHQPSACLVLGRQSDWQQIVDAANSIKHLPSLAVILTAAVEPMASDVDIQRQLQIPSVLKFALTREFPRSASPLASIRSLIDILSVGNEYLQPGFNAERMPAKHCLLLREEIQASYDANEVGCRIGARAIRAGVHPGARIDLFIDGISTGAKENRWGGVFETLFATAYPSETVVPMRERRSYLSLLADRTLSQSKSQFASMEEGVIRLLRMRGWSVERSEQGFVIFNGQRQFSAVFVYRKKDRPVEDRAFERPLFGRSHLLVIHANPNRETLLIGNRGQYCHVTLEDISLMRPEAQWIWSVLRRQLSGRSTRASLAALRLSASLAAEAILMGRVNPSSDWREAPDRLLSFLQADDCERFVDFMPGSSVYDQEIRMRVRMRDSAEVQSSEAEMNLRIEDEGPILSLSLQKA